jgi:glycyl-tRNA synthetase
MAGFYDYGPMGVELKNNIKKIWWRDMVQRREDIVGLDSSIISSSAVWEASGHVAGFSDPMVDCKKTKLRYRADQVFWGAVVNTEGETVCYVSVMESDTMDGEALKQAKKRAKAVGKSGPFQPIVLRDLTEATEDIYDLIPSPGSGEAGDLTACR